MTTTTETWWDEVPWADIRPGDVVQVEREENCGRRRTSDDCAVAAVRPGHPSDRNRLGQVRVTLVGPVDFVTFDRWADAEEPVRCRFPRHIDEAAA